jgi:hypothetical protein
MRHLSAVTVVVLALTGCAPTPGGGLLNTNTIQDAGPKPTMSETRVRSYLNATLKDPYSVMDLSISEPVISFCSVGVYGSYFGWRVDVTYNAKNSYGAYVGLRTYHYWFHGDELKGVGQNVSYCPEAPSWR